MGNLRLRGNGTRQGIQQSEDTHPGLWIAFWLLKAGRTCRREEEEEVWRERAQAGAGEAGSYLDHGPGSVVSSLTGKDINYQMKP